MLSPLTFPLDRVVDAEGRPLFEGRSSKAMRAIAPLEHAVCPYPGSRHNHEKPMNVSGLRQMTAHWEDVISGLGYLRALYPQPAAHTRYIDLWRICNLGEYLPAFLLYRQRDPVPNGQLPANVSGIFKVVIGLIAAARQMAFMSIFQGPEKIEEELSHELLYGFVEAQGLFIGPTEVCAGPESLIREVVNVIREQPAAPDPAQRAKLLLGDIADNGDEEAFLNFSYSRMNGTVLTYLYSILAESLYSRILQAIGSDGRSMELFSPADPQVALLDSLGVPMAQGVLHGILHVAVSNYGTGDRLTNVANQLPGLLNDGAPDPRIAALLGKHAENASVVNDVARYLQLEKISFALSEILKQQCLSALGLEDSLYLKAISHEFLPPMSNIRSLLNVTFGLQVLPNLQVQSRNQIAMSLVDDSAWRE